MDQELRPLRGNVNTVGVAEEKEHQGEGFQRPNHPLRRNPAVLILLSFLLVVSIGLLSSSTMRQRSSQLIRSVVVKSPLTTTRSRSLEKKSMMTLEEKKVFEESKKLAREASRQDYLSGRAFQSSDEKKQGAKESKTSFYHFPDMVAAHENEEEIFGTFRNLVADEDGFVEHNVRVRGHANRYLNVNYRGRYRADVYMHGLELHDDLVKFGCTKKAMVLQFVTKEKANRIIEDLRSALSNGKYAKVLVGGRQIWRCPKSMEPEELRNAHKFHDHVNVEETRITQSLRRVTKVSAMGDDKRNVRLDTSYANLQDVFEDLVFSGETDMIDRQSELFEQKFGVKEDNVDGVRLTDVERRRKENYPVVPVDFDEDGEKKLVGGRKIRVRSDFIKWIKKAWNKVKDFVVNKIVKPVIKLVVEGVKKVAAFVKSVAGTIIKPLVKFLGSLIPVLVNKEGSHATTPISINYNSAQGRASHILEFDTNGIEQGATFDVGTYVSAGVFAKGRVACLNCFIRFYDGVFSWKLIIGGKHLAFVELRMYTKVEAMIELDADIVITTQVTFAPDPIPVPKLSIPLGVMTLGFSVAPEITIGVEFEVSGLYYKYHLWGDQTFGVSGSLLNGVSTIRDGHLNEEMVGPIIKDSLSVSLYVLPLCGLVFSDVMALEAGLQPTFTFELKPRNNAGSGCKLGWSIHFDCPIVIGGWIGLKTKFGMFRLIGFTQDIAVLPTIPIKSGCVSQAVINTVKSISPINFDDGNSGLNKADTRGMSAVTQAENTFTTNFNELKQAYATVTAFGGNSYEWVTGSNSGCYTACKNNNMNAVYSGTYAIDPVYSNWYVCSVNLDNEGYRPGWNRGDPTSNDKNKCTVPDNGSGGHSATGSEFKCLCIPDDRQASISWVQTNTYAGQNCRVTCETAGMYPITSGSYELNGEPAGIFYPCGQAYEATGMRTGMNIGPHHSQFGSECRIALDLSGARDSGNYQCACMKPSKEMEKPVMWVTGQGEPGCQETCDRSGQVPVLAGSDGSSNDYYVCGFPYGNKELEGFSGINQNGEYTACYGRDGWYNRESSETDFRCLCTRSMQGEYVSWVDRQDSSWNCSTTCIWGHDLYPIYAYGTTTEFVCQVHSNSLGATVTGTNLATTSTCSVSQMSSQSSFKCGCVNVDMISVYSQNPAIQYRPSTGPQASRTITSGTYILKNKKSHMVMDVEANSVSGGARITQWTQKDHGDNLNQVWKLIVADSANGWVYVENVNSGLYFDIMYRGANDGDQLIQWSWNGQDNQQFKFEYVGAYCDDCVWITVRATERVLETPNINAGTQVVQWSKNSGYFSIHQQWELIPVNVF